MDLLKIREKWGGCTSCSGMIGGPVLHEGQPSSICFIAEALGRDEVRLERPLIGPAGQVFNRILDAAGIKREDVFLMNTVSCRPPNNKLQGHEISTCAPVREALIKACNPQVIVVLGAIAMKALFPDVKKGVIANRGSVRRYNGIPTVITLHPSYVMRMESFSKSDAESARTVRVIKTNVLHDYLLAKQISQGGQNEQREEERLQKTDT